MAKYEENMQHREYRYQQGCRNWTIYEWRLNPPTVWWFCYDFQGVEALKEYIKGGGILSVDGDIENIRFIEEPDYADVTVEDAPTASERLLAEMAHDFLGD